MSKSYVRSHFFLFAVVGIQSFYGQELRSHFFCSQLLVYKVFMAKSCVLIFPVGSCWYTKLLWARVTFSFFLLAVVGIQSFCEQELGSHFFCWQLLVYKVYGQELSSHFFLLAVVGIQSFYGQELSSHFFCSQLLVYKVFMGKSYLLIFSVGSCWYTKFLWARVTFSFFLFAVVGIQSFYGQELRSHFFCSQLLVYKVFLWPRVAFSFFLLAVVGIQSYYGQELRSHFFCWQLLVNKFFVSKSCILIFSVRSCWYTKFLQARVTF